MVFRSKNNKNNIGLLRRQRRRHQQFAKCKVILCFAAFVAIGTIYAVIIFKIQGNYSKKGHSSISLRRSQGHDRIIIPSDTHADSSFIFRDRLILPTDNLPPHFPTTSDPHKLDHIWPKIALLMSFPNRYVFDFSSRHWSYFTSSLSSSYISFVNHHAVELPLL
jgi:hypothetical protein